jgi:hypothetical protein
MKEDPRTIADQIEATPSLPEGSNERFSGYGVMGLPFTSGHVLAMRRFTASSVGSGYTSLWHRDPDGAWVFYSSVSPRQSCSRFFGAIASELIETEITLTWIGPFRLRVTMPSVRFEWAVEVAATRATRLMNAIGRVLPRAAWQRPAFLNMMGRMAGPLLGVGRIGLHGQVPNGQHFVANPRTMWMVVESRARLAGEDFGPPGAVRPQAHLADFWIPQRGVLAIGEAYFDPFDPAVNSVNPVARTGKVPSPTE